MYKDSRVKGPYYGPMVSTVDKEDLGGLSRRRGC